jgi:hypothetical protein
MALLMPTEGEQLSLQRILNGGDNAKIHLYSDDVTPSDSDTVASYTLITDPAAITLTGGSWDFSSVPGEASYAEQTFTFSGSGTAYGYVITNNAGDTILWAERFTDAPFNIGTDGGSIKVTPTINLS